MKAILLADAKVELYSTDLPPEQWVVILLALFIKLNVSVLNNSYFELGLFSLLGKTTGQKVAIVE